MPATTRISRGIVASMVTLLVAVSVVLSSVVASLCMIPLVAPSTSTVAPIDETLLGYTESDERLDLLVGYRPEAGEIKARYAIQMADKSAEIIEAFEEVNIVRVKLLGKAIMDLAENILVTGIWSNGLRNISTSPDRQTPSASTVSYQSPIDTVGARDLWDMGYNGTGVVIAVLDTGIDFLHADLDDFDDNSSTMDSKVTAYASFVEGDTLPVDIIGHGTYSASIAAGTGNRSAGLYAGIAPGATLLSAKVTLGGLLAAPSWIVSGIEWACSRGADIILMPFNTFGSPGDAVSIAVKAAADKGVFVVAAAGDDGPDYLTIMSPGGCSAAFAVGAYDIGKGEVAAFSGRGPSLDMLTKPDLVAPGVGIIGARAGNALSLAGFGSFDLGDLGGLSSLLGGSFGKIVNDYYVDADSTAAAAAITAGAVALLMEAFDRATPIVLANVLRDTATQLEDGANDAGAGLLNLGEAFRFLEQKQEPIQPHNRTTGTPLLALGLLSTQGRDASTTVLMSSYGTTVVALDQRRNQESSVHLLMGMLALRWEDRSPTNLMEFQVKRELHQVVLNSGLNSYNRWIGILSYDSVYVILLVESYNLTSTSLLPITAFRITPFVLNLGNEPVSNVSLFLSYSLDLFLDGRDDHGKYALANQQLFAYSISESYQSFYVGINSSLPLDAFEVGNSSQISDHVSNDSLTGSTNFDGTVGLAMKWDFGTLPVNIPRNVTVALGFGENRTMLDQSMAAMWTLEPSSQVAGQSDLVVVEADIPRTAIAGHAYESRAVIMNVGANSSQAVGAMIIGQAEPGGAMIFSRFYSFDEIAPFRAETLSTDWSPTTYGMYSAAWVVAAGVEFAIALFANPAQQLATTGVALLDDFLLRDLFVVEPISSTSVFPKRLPFAPFDLTFPADFGLYTVSLQTNIPLGNLTVEKHGNAAKWGNVTLPSSDSVVGYYNFSLFLLVPAITMDDYHRCDYRIVTESGWSANVTLECELRYPRAMMLLDTSHGGGLSITGGLGAGAQTTDSGSIGMGEDVSFDLGSLDSLSSISDLLEQFRMTTFSGLSDIKKAMASENLDLIETPGLSLSEEILSQFSTLFIITPSKEFNSTEIDTLREFTAGGGRLVVFGDYDGRANLTVLNGLLSPYGYAMAGKHTEESTTGIVQDSGLGTGLQSVWLGGGTFIVNNQSLSVVTLTGRPVVLVDRSPPDLVLFGSSRLFMNKNLPKCNNTILLHNLNEYLLSNTLTCVTSLAEKTTTYPVGRSVYINLNVSDYTAQPVNDLTVFIAFELPNGSFAYWIAGFVQEGLYSTDFPNSFYSSSGRVNGIFIVMRTERYAGTFASVSFELYVETTTQPTDVTEGWLTLPQVALITSVSVFSISVIMLWLNRYRRRKRMRIPEVDPELAREIDNSLNNLLAAFIQMEDLIHREDLDRVQKIEVLRGLMKGLEEARKRFDRVSDTIGGV